MNAEILVFLLVVALSTEEEADEDKKSLVIKGLGRPFSLGSLYSRTKEEVVPGTLWKSGTLRQHISYRLDTRTAIKTSAERTVLDRLDLLDVDVSLSCTLMTGKLELSGSAKFVNDKGDTNMASYYILKYRTNTHWESLNMDHLRLLDYPEELEKTEATHVVYQITYGAEAILELKRQYISKHDIKDISAGLKLVFKLSENIKIEGHANLNISATKKSGFEDLMVSFYGDVQLAYSPANFDDAMVVYRSLPMLINEGNSVPVDVYLYPLAKLGSAAGRLARQMNGQMVKELGKTLEKIQSSQKELKDMVHFKKVVQTLDNLLEPVVDAAGLLNVFEKQFQKQLLQYIPKIRRKELSEHVLAEMLESIEKSPFRHETISRWTEFRQREASVLDEYLTGLYSVGMGRLKFDMHLADLSKVYVLAQHLRIGQSKEKLLEVMKNFTRSNWREGASAVRAQPTDFNAAVLRASFKMFKLLYDANQDEDADITFVLYDTPGPVGQITVATELYEYSRHKPELLKLPKKTYYDIFITFDYAAVVVKMLDREDWGMIRGFRMKTERVTMAQKHTHDVKFPLDENGKNKHGLPNIGIMNHTEYPLNKSLPRLQDHVTVMVKPLLKFAFGYQYYQTFRVPKRSISLDRHFKPKSIVNCKFVNLSFTLPNSPEPDFCFHLCQKMPECETWVARFISGGRYWPCSIYKSAKVVETDAEDKEVLNTPYFGGKDALGRTKITADGNCKKNLSEAMTASFSDRIQFTG